MRRREFIAGLSMTAIWPLAARAQRQIAARQVGRRRLDFLTRNTSRLSSLALQLSFLLSSESMGNHDSEIVDADGVG